MWISSFLSFNYNTNIRVVTLDCYVLIVVSCMYRCSQTTSILPYGVGHKRLHIWAHSAERFLRHPSWNKYIILQSITSHWDSSVNICKLFCLTTGKKLFWKLYPFVRLVKRFFIHEFRDQKSRLAMFDRGLGVSITVATIILQMYTLVYNTSLICYSLWVSRTRALVWKTLRQNRMLNWRNLV